MDSDPKSYKVFLSSTGEDLEAHRAAVDAALRTMGQHTVMMEYVGARDERSVPACLELAAAADLVVVLVAWRCGWVPDIAEQGTGDTSITRLEVEAARAAGKPVLAFLADAEGWTHGRDADDLYDTPSEAGKQKILADIGRLQAFRASLSQYLRATFTTPASAAAAVASSVGRWLLQQAAPSAPPADSPFRDPGPALEGWLKKVAADHAQIVAWFDDADTALLDQVYVELGLGPDARVLKGRRDADDALSPRMQLGDLLALDPADYDWITHRWVILGLPGAGKTTLVRRLARRLAQEPERRWIPVFVSLPVFMAGKQDDLVAHALARLPGAEATAVRAALEAAGERGGVLFILDSLDEVPDGRREEARTAISDLSLGWPSCPVVVTSRPHAYQRPGDLFREVRVQPLDRDQRREFLARWFGRHAGDRDAARDRADAAMPQLDHPGLHDLVGNPMYLTLLALVLEQGGTPDRNRASLYDKVFRLLLAGRHKRTPRPLPGSVETHAALAWLAHAHTEEGLEREGRDDTAARFRRDEAEAVRGPLQRVTAWGADQERWLDLLAEHTGIYAGHDGELAGWRFAHRTFREALCSEVLADRYGAGGLDALREHIDGLAGRESRWAEPYALLCGRVDGPDALVRELVRANRALGIRALATAQGVAPDTVMAILTELAEDAEDRSAVFRQIPALVGDAQRAIDLVKRVVIDTKTRDGDELYWLHEALEEIARASPQRRPDAQSAQQFLFLNVEAPPEGLFEHVDTPHAGEVDLWCDVPAGDFLMGSPDGDETAYDREKPRHLVRLSRGFRMGAVPVTNAQYRAFDPGHDWKRWSGVGLDELALHPVVNVSWYAATSFCRWLAACVPGLEGARLPTEAEWEKACRAGSPERYSRGDEEGDLKAVGWYRGNSEKRTHRVGELPHNDYDLFDMHGNAWEWTSDGMLRRYEPSDEPVVDPTGPTDGDGRVLRGGCYWSTGRNCRSAFRFALHPDLRLGGQGFRVVLPPSRA